MAAVRACYRRRVVVIEVFADMCCPFTHVGLRRIVERRAQLGLTTDDLVLRVLAWPLELVNGHPLDAEFIGEECDAIREQVAPDLFAGFQVSQFPHSSIPAMQLAAAAYDIDDVTGERVSLALRDALFEHGRNVGDPTVLAEIAAAHDVRVPMHDPSGVVADWERGRAKGVIGSPHFFAAAGDVFCPSLSIKRVDGHLVIEADGAAIDRFIAQCVVG